MGKGKAKTKEPSEKQIANYSKETLVAFIQENHAFAGEQMFRQLDRIAKWQKYDALKGKLAEISKAEDEATNFNERMKLNKKWRKVFDQQQALLDL